MDPPKPRSVATTFKFPETPEDIPTGIPIGKPFSNYRVYILNKYGQITPPGVPGELCVSGNAVTRGYLNQPFLTHEKYISAMDSRLYRTGDLALWQEDGNIRFLGRIDHQVKIRGYRIELGEIENWLQKHDQVLETVVLAREDKSGDKYICAYVVPSETSGADKMSPDLSLQSNLREYLLANLPAYMIPAYIVPVETFPLNAGGKINKRSLPDPEDFREDPAPRSQRLQMRLKRYLLPFGRKFSAGNASARMTTSFPLAAIPSKPSASSQGCVNWAIKLKCSRFSSTRPLPGSHPK